MDVWLWDAGRHSGVCGDEQQALFEVVLRVAGGMAGTAIAELAHAHLGGYWLKSGYERTGSGWDLSRTADGSVKLTRFHRPLALAAS